MRVVVYGGRTWLRPEALLAASMVISDIIGGGLLRMVSAPGWSFTVKCLWMSMLKALSSTPFYCVCFLGDTSDGDMLSPTRSSNRYWSQLRV